MTVTTYKNTSGDYTITIADGLGNMTINAATKATVAYDGVNIAGSLNSAPVASSAAGYPTAPDRLYIGSSYASGTVISGHIQFLRYYPQRLTNSEQQAFSK